MPDCPFCELGSRQTVWRSDSVVAFRDLYPVTPGHTLIVTRRHCETYFDATSEEQAEIWRAIGEIKSQLDDEFSPQGYNVGFNVGAAGGQTVMHLHVHVIPRYDGDTDDPRGGVRGVIPQKQKYGDAVEESPFSELPGFLGGEEDHFGPVLQRAFTLADEADVITAFVQPAGLAEIQGDIQDALARNATIRIVAGDYLNATSPDALRRLLSLQTEHPDRLQLYFFEGGGSKSFHAKAYIFRKGPHGVAYVGSSNLTRTALTTGIEWNLHAVTSGQPTRFAAIQARFESVLESPLVRPLTRELIDRYSERAQVPKASVEDAAEGPEPRQAPPPPHTLQEEALAALEKLREEEVGAGLVVMATGLGKTYLSALDFQQVGGKRALFIAHREEILTQARDSWARVFPDKVMGLLLGGRQEPDADILFASVQTLARKTNLTKFSPDHFDYIVVDEFHHAAAGTYRRVLGYFEPRFLLGLTATPDRMDGAPILELCHNSLAYRAGLIRGIASKLLVPFRYFGVKDEVDFTAIPWRGRWPVEELTQAVTTQSRAEQTVREYRKHAPEGTLRTLAFCCSIAHADFMAEYFRSQGIRAVAVHSESTSAPREESLRKLRRGELEVLCAVDIFNEGLDVPDINTVLMLRPTESPVVFLQQLGRGLRRPKHSQKSHLTVVDFIGNHRSFMIKPQALVALVGLELPAGAALARIREGDLDLPEGCSVEIETEAIDMLEKVSRLSQDDMLIYEYTSLRDSHGRRPTAAEVHAAGVHMKPVTDRYGTWFDFVDKQGDLTEDQRRVLKRHRRWFQDLMTTSMTRSYKMVTLKALLSRDRLRTAMSVADIVDQAHRILHDDPVLKIELEQASVDGVVDLEKLRVVWRDMPLKSWARGKSTSRKWFDLEGDTFRFRGEVAREHAELFDEMTSELVEYRLADHRDRLRYRSIDQALPIRLRVSHAGGRPILRLDRDRRPDLPAANTDVPVHVDGQSYLFGFRKVAVNTAVREPGGTNELPTLMRSWYGAAAGQPGSRHYVLLERRGRGWQLRRGDGSGELAADRIEVFPKLPFYPSLQVACGAWSSEGDRLKDAQWLRVASNAATDSKRHFVVRASGDSMDGGETPIRDGDLVLCEWTTESDPHSIEGQACLLSGRKPDGQGFEVLKIPVRVDGNWELRSWNPSYEPTPLDSGTRLHPVGRFLEVVNEAPEPMLWEKYDRPSVARLFGARSDRSWQVGHRDLEVHGKPHTVLFVNLKKSSDVEPQHRYADEFRSPSEFQWESQATTSPESKKGRAILEHATDGRAIHLFCRYTDKAKGKTMSYVYCGTLQYQRHQGSKPIRVLFTLDHPLPDELWRVWST